MLTKLLFSDSKFMKYYNFHPPNKAAASYHIYCLCFTYVQLDASNCLPLNLPGFSQTLYTLRVF